MKLVEPAKTIEIIKENNFAFQKKYGQNFLIDGRVLEKIVDAAQVSSEDFIIEIGPGIGTLTQALCERGAKVLAIEIDKKLIPILEDNLKGYENIEIINDDVMKLDLNRLIEEKNENRPVKIVANLPYYITTPIIMSLFEKNVPMISATLMVQKEVAQRMQAGPGSKAYGALSLSVQYYSVPEITANVPQNCFIPRPNVDSAIIRLNRRNEPPVRTNDEKLLFAVIRAAFCQRRKTLQNALSNSAELSVSKEAAANAIEKAQLPPLVRGEALRLEEFAALANILAKEKTGIGV